MKTSKSEKIQHTSDEWICLRSPLDCVMSRLTHRRRRGILRDLMLSVDRRFSIIAR